MKLSACLLFILQLCLAACAAERPIPLPELTPGENHPDSEICESIFPRGRWQFVHSIDFSMDDGSGATVVGVTILDRNQIACALMTIEGFTLFEAVYREDGDLEVKRAVPPFDRPAFAEGLMRDVKAIFQPPADGQPQSGRKADQTPVCRYTGDDGRVTDILPAMDGCWQINTFTTDRIMDRAIVGRSCREMEGCRIPEYLELTGYGQAGYTLKMFLLNAENLNRDALP